MNTLLPLVSGYIVTSVLEKLGAAVTIKWPNDILQLGQKVGGMLIEENKDTSILGFGLNLADCPPESDLREDHSVPAAKIVIPSFSGGPLSLLETLVNRGRNVYEVMLDEIPPAQLLVLIENNLAWIGKDVLVREGGETPYKAVIVGLSPKGGLVLRHRGKERVVFSGSIFPL
ncbi:hypothetical protein PSDVSF_03500 [Pseudodesulfovibrio sediminis]|uniref:BPL/LPL catalytic domain-containing protein n=2 Tax=Pseudodesulfovibrio sediminis TaxID=2810563 RepID=A0ABM7P2U4_9BACT|nr:hypothetical protein PSDVSF_03500 [Pseudodesulfovibrio sediminis]